MALQRTLEEDNRKRLEVAAQELALKCKEIEDMKVQHAREVVDIKHKYKRILADELKRNRLLSNSYKRLKLKASKEARAQCLIVDEVASKEVTQSSLKAQPRPHMGDRQTACHGEKINQSMPSPPSVCGAEVPTGPPHLKPNEELPPAPHPPSTQPENLADETDKVISQAVMADTIQHACPSAWRQATRHAEAYEEFGVVGTPVECRRDSMPDELQNEQKNLPLADNYEYKYQQVVRRKDERERLPAFECESCRKFFEALETWGQPSEIGQVLSCGHTVQLSKEALMQVGGRHRYRYKPPDTPRGYWDMNLTPVKK